MIPKFVDQQDLSRFLRALPEVANYRDMLNNDFSYKVPLDASLKDMEGLWKYRVYNMVTNHDVIVNSSNINSFMADLYQSVVEAKKYVPSVAVMKKSKKPKYIPERKNGCGFKGKLEGAVVVVEEDGRWFGYVGSSLVASSPSRKYVVNRLMKRGFNV